MITSNHMSFTTSEMVSYRLDYHFSASKLAKPTLLFAVTFILILVSTIGFALVSGESFAGRDMNEVSTCRARQSTPLVFLRLRLALFHARLMTAYSNSVKQNACPTFTPLWILCV